MPPRQKKSRLGKQPPRFNFFLNPYAAARFTTCPQCGGRTRQRKLPLVIHVGDNQAGAVSLNKTCRYCPTCDLLIAHKSELDPLIERLFASTGLEGDPREYLALGTLDRQVWLRGTKGMLTIADMIENLHDFVGVWVFEPG